MKTKQTIAVIGAAWNMGAAIARNLSKGNYKLFSKEPKEVKALSLAANLIHEKGAIYSNANLNWNRYDNIISI